MATPLIKERRFRASIYLEVWVPETESLESDRVKAFSIVKKYANLIPNSYVGGAAAFTGNANQILDREI